MKKMLIILSFCLLLCGCKNSYAYSDLEKLMNGNEYLIADVRTKDEYNESHIVGSINVPYDEIKSDSFDKEKLILVYCRSGRRSKNAYDFLKDLGYNVYDLGSFDKIDLEKE